MQTELWCTRCRRFVPIELQLKKVGRGSTKLAQLVSLCPRCRRILHTQTTTLKAAEEMIQRLEKLREEATQAISEEAEASKS